MKRRRDNLCHFNIDWEFKMDHSESARENAKVRQAQNLLGRTTVRERNNLIECSLGAEAQLSHQPSAGWPWAGLISSAGLLFHICQSMRANWLWRLFQFQQTVCATPFPRFCNRRMFKHLQLSVWWEAVNIFQGLKIQLWFFVSF